MTITIILIIIKDCATVTLVIVPQVTALRCHRGPTINIRGQNPWVRFQMRWVFSSANLISIVERVGT